MDTLTLIGRDTPLFDEDIKSSAAALQEISDKRFLLIGGAGSIGQAVAREIFVREPKTLHLVDLSENNMVEVVRDLRSSKGYIQGDFRTFAVDCGSVEFEALVDEEGPYDYVLNLSALKHVRSEKDPYTLMRLIDVNIFNTLRTLEMTRNQGASKYFCVSTDKAANPVNMMGASKRIMEMFLMRASASTNVSTARFANVAFSDGSLLHGFNQRFLKNQPISAPSDVKRYFVTPQESGELCLMSCLLGENRDIFFPKLVPSLNLTSFSEIAIQYLLQRGFEPYVCDTEEEARAKVGELRGSNKWPCYFFKSDTTGEKGFEEFYTSTEEVDFSRFSNIGIVKNSLDVNFDDLDRFTEKIKLLKTRKSWSKSDLVDIFQRLVPEFRHIDTGKYLDGRM